MAHFHNYIELCVAIALHAKQDNPITAPMLETLYDLSPRKIESLVRKLVKGGILDSMRGHHGGYFIENVDRVTLYDIYKVYLADTIEKPAIFNILKQPIQECLREIRRSTYEEKLRSITLASLLIAYKDIALPQRDYQEFIYYI